MFSVPASGVGVDVDGGMGVEMTAVGRAVDTAMLQAVNTNKNRKTIRGDKYFFIGFCLIITSSLVDTLFKFIPI